MALLDKVSDGKGVLEDIARCEALVRLWPISEVFRTEMRCVTHHVEEGEVLLLLADVREFFPLLLRRVDTGWVLTWSARIHRYCGDCEAARTWAQACSKIADPSGAA